tara:strand:- start:14139 stop:14291 length:153 start_codon:yes stop_codon:yes gene_type:complete
MVSGGKVRLLRTSLVLVGVEGEDMAKTLKIDGQFFALESRIRIVQQQGYA